MGRKADIFPKRVTGARTAGDAEGTHPPALCELCQVRASSSETPETPIVGEAGLIAVCWEGEHTPRGSVIRWVGRGFKAVGFYSELDGARKWGVIL